MSSSRVRSEGGLALIAALRAPSLSATLKRLDLGDSMFGEEGGAALAEALSSAGMPAMT